MAVQMHGGRDGDVGQRNILATEPRPTSETRLKNRRQLMECGCVHIKRSVVRFRAGQWFDDVFRQVNVATGRRRHDRCARAAGPWPRLQAGGAERLLPEAIAPIDSRGRIAKARDVLGLVILRRCSHEPVARSRRPSLRDRSAVSIGPGGRSIGRRQRPEPARRHALAHFQFRSLRA